MERRGLQERVLRSAAEIVFLHAPAGYGKTTFARQLAGGHPGECLTLDLASGSAEIASCWKAGGILLADDLDRLEEARAAGALRELLAKRPAGARLILCSRTALPSPIRLTDFVAPHLTLTLRSDDLSFGEDETRSALEHYTEPAVAALQAFTSGWPAAVGLLAGAPPSKPMLDSDDRAPPFAMPQFHDFLEEQVFAQIPASTLRALLIACGMSGARSFEIQDAAAESDDDRVCSTLIRTYQLAAIDEQDRVLVTPVLAQAARAKRAGEMRAALVAMAGGLEGSGLLDRAAQAFVCAGKLPEAEALLGRIDPEFSNRVAISLRLPHAQFDAALSWYPHVWSALFVERTFVDPPAQVAREARDMLDARRPDSPDSVVNNFVALAATALRVDSRMDEVDAVLERARPLGSPLSGADLRLLAVRALLAARLGHFERAKELWRKMQRHATSGEATSYALFRVDAFALRARGEWFEECLLLEQMIDLARKSQVASSIGIALGEAAFGAWLAGDEERLAKFAAQFELHVRQAWLPGFESFRRALRGEEPAEMARHGIAPWDARSLLVLAARTPGRAGEQYARRGIELSDRGRLAFPRVLCRLACAFRLDGDQRRPLLDEAAAIAATIESEPLQQCIARLNAGDLSDGMLAAFTARFMGDGVSDAPAGAGTGALHVNISNGTFFLNDRPLEMPEGSALLLIALALAQRPLGRDELYEMLWPDANQSAAAGALKMSVHRTRQRLGRAGDIVAEHGCYALGPLATVDLAEAEGLVSQIARRQVSGPQRRRAEHFYEMMQLGRPGWLTRCEWFVPHEYRIQSITRALGGFLGEKALDERDFAYALDIARTLFKLDPLDESGCALAIKAHLGLGNRAAARNQLRDYQTFLAAELGAEPSPELLGLIEGTPPAG